MSKFKNAAIRAYRTAVMVFVSSGAVANIPAVRSLADLKVVGSAWLLAAVLAIAAGVVAFLVNTAEDTTPLNLGPKG